MTDVLVCGSAVVDLVFHVDAMPTAPEKYAARSAEIVGGGCAANAAVAIARLGGRAHLMGRRGRDPIGALIADDLAAEGVHLALFPAGAGRSAFSSIYVDAAGERQIMAFRGADLTDDPAPLIAAAPPIAAVLADNRWPAGGRAALDLARDRGVPGVLDGEAAVEDAADLFAAASHTVFSAQGLRHWFPAADLAASLAAAAAAIDGWVAVTDGPAGVLAPDGHHPAFPVTAVDSLAAGDVWHGAFALALAEGRPEAAAIRFASATAALKVTRPGGRKGAPSRAEVENLLKGAL